MVLVAIGLVIAALEIALVVRFSPMPAALGAGLFAGSLTNTPALAAVVDQLRGRGVSDAVLALPVVGYSVAYPVSVFVTLLTLHLGCRLLGVDPRNEPGESGSGSAGQLVGLTIKVTQPAVVGRTLEALRFEHGWDVSFGRVRRGSMVFPATGESVLESHDLVTVIGTQSALSAVLAVVGVPSDVRIELDRSKVDYRRIFVSNPKVAGHALRDLDLPQHFGAVVTRLRRGDVELVPTGDTIIELGDRIRVVTRRQQMASVTEFFGDSYKALSEFDIPTFSLGLALGLLVGCIPISLPGGLTVTLGLAGGPLVVALVLGHRHRTGPFVWTIPYSANMTLRQLGVILFLCGIGTRSGAACLESLKAGGGLALVAWASAIAASTTGLVLWLGFRRLGLPMGVLMGVVAGMQTQPAVLGFALEKSGDERPNHGYAMVYPLAMFTKIILAQLVVATLGP